VLANWNTVADGSGSAPTAIANTDDFVADKTGWFMGATAGTFGGKSLTVGPRTQTLSVSGSTSTATIPNLVTLGSAMIKGGYTQSNLAVTSWLIPSDTTRIINHTNSGALFQIVIGTLTGSGNINLTAGSATGLLKLTATDATSYVGTVTLTSGKLEFMNALSSGGALVVLNPGDVTLNQPVIFTGLTVAGVVKAAGSTYTAAQLGFLGTGSVTVRNPATWYLTTSQTGSQDWTQAYKTNWTANANGTGGTAPSINIVDTYVHNVGTNLLRTPATSSTFLGGTLSLGGTTQLVLNGTGSAISTLPNLVSTGGTITVGTVTRHLDIDTHTLASGTTTISTGSGGVLNLYVRDFKGGGNLVLSGTGQLVPFIDEGNGFTGTITVNSGARLNVTTLFASGGALVVNSGGLVTLNDWAYVTGLTVNGVVKPVGTHSAASLGFSGTGTIIVYNRDIAGPPQMFGVNFAGADFAGTAFWQTNAAMWDYYQAKGLTLIRMPFKWARIQPTYYGAVTFTQMDQLVALANARGMKIIWDMHDYNQRDVGGTLYLVGTPQVPTAALVDVWVKIADRYKNEPCTYGYDLMNEPKGTLENWAAIAQTCVDAMRKVDQKNYIIVEGMNWAKASSWVASSGALDIKDPAGRLIYSAHSYWDYQDNIYAQPPIYASNGGYEPTDLATPNAGVNHVKPFVEWLQTRPYAHGFVGEYCTPDNVDAADWNIELGNFLAYLRANNVSGTYWAAGNNWTASHTVCQPQPFPGTDKLQMSVLELYNNVDTWTSQDIGAVITAGSATEDNGTFTVKGAGWDIWNAADGFHYVHQEVSGDCTITARIVTQSASPTKGVAGVMIRESLAADSTHAFMNHSVSGSVDLSYRLTTAGVSGHAGGVSGLALPYWVRLVRSGNTFKGYRSADVGGAPANWVQHGVTKTITMTAPTIYVGLPVCGKSGSPLSTATFDNVTVTTP
jgi:endoglucanase